MAITTIETFLKKESASGIILMFAAVFAMIFANSPWVSWY
ncbi:MAG: Na+/H+ antiporter NhaA, partial [Colwellia sp.]|nr:Na+/H+ antiporter NhaA [Colwellia sp.]